MDFLAPILQFLMGIPTVGPWVAAIVSILIAAGPVCTAIVGVMHAVSLFAKALSLVPYLGGLSKISDALSQKDAALDGFISGKVKKVLDWFAMIPLPKK